MASSLLRERPGRAQTFFRRSQNLLGRREAVDQPAASADAPGVLREQRFHPAGDGGRNFSVELLINDGLQQRLEDALRGFLLHMAGAIAGDDARQVPVDAGEVFTGGSVIEFHEKQLSVVSCQLSVEARAFRDCVATVNDFCGETNGSNNRSK